MKQLRLQFPGQGGERRPIRLSTAIRQELLRHMAQAILAVAHREGETQDEGRSG